MKPRLTFIWLCLGALVTAPAMFADVTDYLLNINGSTYCPSSSTVACGSFGGFAAAGATSSLDLSSGGTGLGTVTVTISNTGSSSVTDNVGFWLFEQLSQPGYNEYGNTGGTAAGNQSWQIDVPDYDYIGELGTSGAGSIIGNTIANTLANTNFIPGQDSTYDGGGFCATFPDPTCNDYTSMAMAFQLTVDPGDQGVFTFNVSTTQPTSGFYLEQIHPVDGANGAETDYYFTGSAMEQPIGTQPPPTVPEPASWVLLATVAGLVLTLAKRRSARI